jgi:hypothetical protein
MESLDVFFFTSASNYSIPLVILSSIDSSYPPCSLGLGSEIVMGLGPEFVMGRFCPVRAKTEANFLETGNSDVAGVVIPVPATFVVPELEGGLDRVVWALGGLGVDIFEISEYRRALDEIE